MKVLKTLMIVVPWVVVALLMARFYIKELHLTKRLKSVALVGIILYFFSPLWLWGIFSFIPSEILTTFFIVWVVLWLLIWLFFSFYGAYSLGIDEGYKVAENPQQKTIEIRDTWPSQILHACKTFIFLSIIICFFPWFLAYRLGRRKGVRKYKALQKQLQQEELEKDEYLRKRKYTYEYYDNPHDHTPNAYGYCGTDNEIKDIERLVENVAKDYVNENTNTQTHLTDTQKQRLKDFLTNKLARPERVVIVLYYYEELTMGEIAEVLELPESEVSQMHSSIIARCKSYLQEQGQL